MAGRARRVPFGRLFEGVRGVMSKIARAIEEDLVAWEKQDTIWTEPPMPDSLYFYDSSMAKGCHYSESRVDWDDNWQCPFCNSLHPLTKYTCANCGAARIREH